MVWFVLFSVGHDYRCYLSAGEVYARRTFADSDASPLNGCSLVDKDTGVQVDTHDNVLSSLWTAVPAAMRNGHVGCACLDLKPLPNKFESPVRAKDLATS